MSLPIQETEPGRRDAHPRRRLWPWLLIPPLLLVAGVATLYTPEFFRIVRRRLADDGVFCQWVQLYQLPLPVVATIVANVRDVFPHAELWYSSPWDLMVVASGRPLRYDRAWLERLFADPRIGALGREYLNVNRPEQYVGHLVMGDAGTAGGFS